jgi:hypothetical protein
MGAKAVMKARAQRARTRLRFRDGA